MTPASTASARVAAPPNSREPSPEQLQSVRLTLRSPGRLKTEVLAGLVVHPIEHAAMLLRAFRDVMRDAPEELVEIADLVSEIQKIKHPFDEGYRGQKGIEW